MTSTKATRVRFSIAKKIELLDLVKKGKSRPVLCKENGIAPSTLQNFLRDEKKLRAEFENNWDTKRQKVSLSPHHELEQKLVKWVHVMRNQKISLNGPLVQEKALEFAEKMGIQNFSTSGGWLYQFTKRENLDFKARYKNKEYSFR